MPGFVLHCDACVGSQSAGPCGLALSFVNMARAHFYCAHLVIIKGTQVYDSSKGSFVDLSVLDVLQVFGRAGRPGFETSGEGYICTTEDKLQHYLDAVTSQVAHRALISTCYRLTIYADSHRVTVCTSSYGKTVTDILLSRFVKGMVNAMNAEIALGTVTTVHDAVRWLGYTYLFVRMQKTPTIYGELSPRDSSPQWLKSK